MTFSKGDKVTYQKSKRERGNAVISQASSKANHFYIITETEGTIMVPAGELESRA